MARGAVLKCSSTTRGDSSCPLDPFNSMALLSRVIPEYPSRKTDKRKTIKLSIRGGKSMDNEKPKITPAQRRLLFGSVFLMATSAIGPAFLTQTTVFTEQFLASFAFAIVVSIIIDIGAQLNIWRVLSVSGKRGQEVANEVAPGLGYVVAFFIVLGGLAFNIGNVAGAGLGFNAIFGLDVRLGAAIAGAFAIFIFLVKNGRAVMDVVTQILGILMIGITAYVMIQSNPPYGEAAFRTFVPEDPVGMFVPIVTIVGGTVGGYITFAGAHRLIEAGMT